MKVMCFASLALSLTLTASAKDALFFVGAHPDDSEGYAATAFLLREKYDLHVIDLTRGELGLGPKGLEDGSTARRRTEEEKRACAVLGATPHFLHETDGCACAGKPSVDALVKLINELKPRAVFTHWPVDNHADHVQTAAVVANAIRVARVKPERYFFEVMFAQTANYRPLYRVDVTETFAKKMEMLSCYACQNEGNSLLDDNRNRAEVRGRESGCAYAETFTTFDGRPIPGGVLDELVTEPRISVFAKFVRMTAKERGLSLAQAADRLYALGVRGYDCSPDDGDLDELAKTKLRPINFYYFPDWFGSDLRDGNTAFADRTKPADCLKLAKRYGIPRIMVVPPNFTGGRENPAEFEKILAQMKDFVAQAKKESITVTVEDFGGTENCCSYVKYLKRLLAEIPDLRFALDSGNLRYAGRGEDILDLMAFAKGRIAHVHLKDQPKANREYVTLGLGLVPNEKIVRAMKAAGYAGWYTLENPVGDTYADTVRQTAVLKDWLGVATSR